MILVFATPEEGRELLRLSTRQPEIVRPQTSGPCVHYGLYGCEVPREDGQCPHLDNASIVCPIKDALGAAQAYAPAEPESVEPEPDDGALHTYTVPATRKPTNPNAWSDEEEEVIRRARNAKEAVTLYYGAYPQSSRTYAATQSRWYKLRAAGELIAPTPTPDFVGDTPPVTQCDEDPVFTVPHPTFRPGDQVRITHALHRGQTGKIERYFPATEDYLVAIDGLPDRIIIRDKDLEVEA